MEYETGRSSSGLNAKARITGFADGLIELIFRVSDTVVLEVRAVGELASELIHIGQFVMRENGTLDCFTEATFAVPHPERSVHVRGLRRTRAPRPATADGSFDVKVVLVSRASQHNIAPPSACCWHRWTGNVRADSSTDAGPEAAVGG